MYYGQIKKINLHKTLLHITKKEVSTEEWCATFLQSHF